MKIGWTPNYFRRTKAPCRNCGSRPPDSGWTPIGDDGPGYTVTSRGRFTSLDRVPFTGPAMRFQRQFDRTYDVQAFTGWCTSNVPQARWARGRLVRWEAPGAAGNFRADQRALTMYDPLNPNSWGPPSRSGR